MSGQVSGSQAWFCRQEWLTDLLLAELRDTLRGSSGGSFRIFAALFKSSGYRGPELERKKKTNKARGTDALYPAEYRR
jgi:hypothetical protein